MEYLTREQLQEKLQDWKTYKEYVNECAQNAIDIGKHLIEFNKAILLLTKYGFEFEQSKIDEIKEKLNTESQEAEMYLCTARSVYKEFQDNCDHNYVLSWWDSHHDYYECTKCGQEIKN